MQTLIPTRHRWLLVLVLGSVLSACNGGSDDEEDDDVSVARPANEILLEEGSLHRFHMRSFYRDSVDIDNDIMILDFDNFRPAASNVEPDEDDDQTLNDLPYSKDSWNETTVSWASISNPLLADSTFQKIRSWRVLSNNNLWAPVQRLNQPIYETIDENVFERQLATRFVWDFGGYGDIRTDLDLSGDAIEDYQTLYGFDFLPYAQIWAESGGWVSDGDFDFRFSEGATVYGASRSVASDTLVVESVDNNGEFDLALTRFGQGLADIDTALAAYPHAGARLAYRFTVDYSQHHIIYLSFDTALKTVRLYSDNSGGSHIAETAYNEHPENSYIEIDTSALDSADRILLGLPAYFHPIITGPFTSDGSISADISQKAYYYGKRYIRTDELNRLALTPYFFMNNTAKEDIKRAFREWREQEHLDND